MGRKVNRVSNLRGAGNLDCGNIRVGPDNLRTVAAIELFDSFARITCDLTKRIGSVESSGIGLAFRSPLCGDYRPIGYATTDQRSNFFRAVELRNA